MWIAMPVFGAKDQGTLLWTVAGLDNPPRNTFLRTFLMEHVRILLSLKRYHLDSPIATSIAIELGGKEGDGCPNFSKAACGRPMSPALTPKRTHFDKTQDN